MSFVPYAVSWNLTSRCNLACDHCYLDAGNRECGDAGELSAAKAIEIVDQIAAVNKDSVLILTGGEPLLRPDIYDIVARSAGHGLLTVLGTNGTLLTPERCARLKEAGLAGVGVSIDSLDAARHDNFRGMSGALEKSKAGLLAARQVGLGIQVQTTPTRETVSEIPEIARWAHELGAKVFNIFFLVCTGRGEQMADISPEQYEQVLKWAAAEGQNFPGMMVRPKCAPHFKRILHQEDPDHDLLKTYVAACRAGTHYCRIDPVGKVTPCPYMDISAGDLNEQEFAQIWNDAPELKVYRDPKLLGKCGACRYRLLCGGCRARALATLDDVMAEDQWCVYEPVGQEEAIVNIDVMAKFGEEGDSSCTWSEEASAILNKIPFFARPMVRLGVEKRAGEEGVTEISLDFMRKAAPSPKMFDEAPKDAFAGSAPEAKKTSEANNLIPMDDDVVERIKNAPDFVRPGIPKLLQKRARERGKTRIDDAFVTEIRDESMMLASRRMKKLGFGELDMASWDTARDTFDKSPDRQKVIDKIVALLGDREKPNEKIVGKFESFFADDVGEKMGWAEDARKRMEKAPFFIRSMARKGVEKYAREHGYKYVTLEALDEAMANGPMANFKRPGSRSD